MLPSPKHFEQLAESATVDSAREAVVCGNSPDDHIARLEAYAQAGYDEVFVGQMGGYHEQFHDFYCREVLPAFG